MGENGENGGWWSSGKQDEAEDACSYTKVRSKTCTAVEDPDTKKPIFKCEKVEKLLKHCPGRRSEVVESKTEHTEEEIPEEDNRGYPGIFGPDSPLSRFTEAIEDELSSGLESFFKAAEDITDELFGQFGYHRDRGDQPDREFEARRSPRPRADRTFPGEQEQEPPDEYWDYRKEFKGV